jgi:hypothetical protein
VGEVVNDLGKWPVLIAAGPDLSPEKAMEILVATTQWGVLLDLHDWKREWSIAVMEILGMTQDPEFHGMVDPDSVIRFHERIGLEPLNYVGNQQIVAPGEETGEGWLTTGGAVGSRGTYLLAKRPRLADVHREWALLADRFPELTMSVQLLEVDHEPEPSQLRDLHAGWRLEGGKLSGLPSGDLVADFHLMTPEESYERVMRARRGRGTDPELIRAAVKRLESAA